MTTIRSPGKECTVVFPVVLKLREVQTTLTIIHCAPFTDTDHLVELEWQVQAGRHCERAAAPAGFKSVVEKRFSFTRREIRTMTVGEPDRTTCTIEAKLSKI